MVDELDRALRRGDCVHRSMRIAVSCACQQLYCAICTPYVPSERHFDGIDWCCSSMISPDTRVPDAAEMRLSGIQIGPHREATSDTRA